MALSLKSFGGINVAAAGTAVRVTAVSQLYRKLIFSAGKTTVNTVANNTGNAYILSASAKGASNINVIAVLRPTDQPLTLSQLESASDGFDPSTIWIDVDTNGDGVTVAGVQ